MAHRASRNFAALFRYARASSRFNQCPPGARYRTFASPSGRSRDPVPLRFPLDRPDATRGFFPLACSTLRGSRSLADRDANHSIIALPRGARIKPVQPPPPPPPPSSSLWHGASSPGNPDCPCEIRLNQERRRKETPFAETVKNIRFRRRQSAILI